ncbi:fungal specific transcription factor, putative [Paecilomyces variotii No. 5]|uniref:Fungal specific transcription factor, putative n=1 Tax=Byssochlamys spectabilis (strain No. 5 / NBRC 109023) TaxID=1356009 RepID=V5I4P3_BYSSN|nr:fungal specific transcription factor, putative [Paecilomyces variotii No. 5]
MFRLGSKALKQIEDARARPYEVAFHQPQIPQDQSSKRNGEEVLSGITKTRLPEQEAGHVAVNVEPEDQSLGRTDPVAVDASFSLGEDFDRGNFEDIDAFFGEYLDLSLPTNFWDPMFMADNDA